MRRYHWIITLQVFKPQGGTSFVDCHGTVTPVEGATRKKLFEQAKAHVCKQVGVDPARTTVMYFSLEPDELS